MSPVPTLCLRPTIRGCLLLWGLFFTLAPWDLGAAGRPSWVSALKGPKDQVSTASLKNQTADDLLEQQAQSKRLLSRGYEYQDIRFKPGIQVSSKEFFTRYAKDLKIGGEDRFVQRLSQPNNMIPDKPRVVIRYQQHYKGFPVLGTSYILQTDAEDRVMAASGKFVAGLDVPPTPTLSEPEALEAAKAAAPAKVYSWDQDPKRYPKGTLAIDFKDDKMTPENARLVYEFVISSEEPRESYTITVDANTKEILSKVDNFTPDVPPTWNQNYSNCSFTRYEDGNVYTETSCDLGADGKFRLMCQTDLQSSCTAPIKVIDARRPNPQAEGDEDPDQDYVFVDNNNQTPPVFGEASVPGEMDDRIGASYYSALRYSLKFFDFLFGWEGFDGDSAVPILVYVKKIENPSWLAFYDPTTDSITMDPDKASAAAADNIGRMAHEFTHGFLHHAIDIGHKGETVFLNESFADIFRCIVLTAFGLEPNCVDLVDPNSRSWPDTYKGYYYVGTSDCGPASPCYHTPDKTVACDGANCDRVHQNGAVQSFMFTLLADGGSGTSDPPSNYSYHVKGIGYRNAATIAYQTILARLPSNFTYPEARDAWVAAAEDLYGPDSREVHAVENAWIAVGIGDPNDPNESHSPETGAEKVPPWPATLTWTDHLPPDVTRQVMIIPPDQDDEGHSNFFLKKATTFPMLLRPEGNQEEGEEDSGGLELHYGDSSTNMTSNTTTLTLTTQPMFSFVNLNLKTNTLYQWRTRTGKPKEPKASAGGLGFFETVTDWAIGTEKSDESEHEMEWGEWSPFYSFTTDERVCSLTSPQGSDSVSGSGRDIGRDTGTGDAVKLTSDKAKADPWEPIFQWGAAEGAKYYKVQLSEIPGPIVEPVSSDGAERGEGTTVKTQKGELKEPFFGIWVDPSESTFYHDEDGFKAMLPEPLKVNATYYWGVQPWTNHKDEFIPGNWSNGGQWQVFQTLTPQGELGSPADGAEVDAWAVHLQWVPTPGAQGYLLKVSKDLACVQDPVNCPDNAYPGTADSVWTNVVFSLSVQAENEVYYWSITPKGPTLPDGSYEFGLPSDPRSFTVDASATKPELVYPLSTNTPGYKNENLTYRWKPVTRAKEYRLTLYQQNADGTPGTADYDSTVTAGNLNSDGEEYVTLFGQGTSNLNGYCWKVQAFSPDGFAGIPSDLTCYEMGPDRPILISPASDATGVDYKSVTFTWNSEYAPEGYVVYWTNGTTPKTTAKSYTVTNLQPDTTYQWSVAASLGGYTSLSDHQNFTTKGCDPMAAPVYILPSGTSTCESTAPATYSVSTQWGAVSGAVQYEVALYRFPNALSNDFTTRETVVAPQYTTGTSWGSATLSKDLWYGWTLRAQNSCGEWGPVSPYYFTNFICFYQ